MLEFFDKTPVIIVIVLGILVFGAKRLPDSARALGQSMRILKAETKGLKDDDTKVATPAPVTAPAPVVQTVAQPVVAQPVVVQPAPDATAESSQPTS